jgi:AcrR family transcriptional regulator
VAGAKVQRRKFDRDEVLDKITRAFWRTGYSPTSIIDITRLTGVNPPSLYATFGDKQTLFTQVVEHYQQAYGAFTVRALADEPTAYTAIGRMLREAAVIYSAPDRPAGCLVINAAMNMPEESAQVTALLRDLRTAGRQAIQDKIAHDTRTGALPAEVDPRPLATFYATVIQGMSTQARDGTPREQLELVAEIAMRAWPRSAVGGEEER